MKIIPETATKFLVYEEVKRWLQKEPNQKITLSERLIAGAAAGSASQTLIYPMDVVKTRLALRRTARPLEIMKVIVSSYQKHGLFWFFKGYLVNLTGVLLFASIDMPLYEVSRYEQPSLLCRVMVFVRVRILLIRIIEYE
ncbi:hypothetical protein AAG570_000068 [Ranatra chinensis]|uniref:Uncharacterized protein n=1 Tax=Ranatra chinensis TaxID=642074 RepID=A0ABD0YWM8_9HEMI